MIKLSDHETISKVNAHIRTESKHRTERMVNFFKLIYLPKQRLNPGPNMKQACYQLCHTVVSCLFTENSKYEGAINSRQNGIVLWSCHE
jgi:hypothetical protein